MARPAVLSGLLDTANFDVVFARDRRFETLFPQLEVRQRNLYSISTAAFLEALAKGVPLYSAKVLEQYIEDDLRVIDEEAPDLLVGDFRLSLSVSARLRKIPYLTITNAYWSPHARQPYCIPEHPLTDLLGVTLANALFQVVRPAAFALHTLPLNNLRRRYGLKSLGFNLNRVYTDSDYTLYCDVPSLVKLENLPASHHFLGPVLWSPQLHFPDWWQQVEGAECNVYLTLGTSGRADLLPTIVSALKDLPVQLLVATAGQAIPAHDQSARVFFSEYLPGEAVAARSRLVICNGGSLTTYQAFSQGVPVLGIAGNLDQHLNMSAIERRGAGLRMRTDALNADQLRAAVLTLIEQPSYTVEACKLRDEMASLSIESTFSTLLQSI